MPTTLVRKRSHQDASSAPRRSTRQQQQQQQRDKIFTHRFGTGECCVVVAVLQRFQAITRVDDRRDPSEDMEQLEDSSDYEEGYPFVDDAAEAEEETPPTQPATLDNEDIREQFCT